MSKVIGIVGTRLRDSDEDFALLLHEFDDIYEAGDTIVSGGCPKGGDRFAEVIAESRNIPIKIHYPEKGKSFIPAAFKRNTIIAKECDVLIAVVSNQRKGGTEDTVSKAKKFGKKIVLVFDDDPDILRW
jgi:hypothetical protein